LGGAPGDHVQVWSGGRNVSMDAITDAVGGMEYMDHPVINRTGLAGDFDYTVEWDSRTDTEDFSAESVVFRARELRNRMENSIVAALFLQAAAATPPESYLHRLFSPENLPNIGLLVAGIFGIVVAICTLLVIRRQTKATEVAATAAQNEIASLDRQFSISHRPWVSVSGEIKNSPLVFSDRGAHVTVSFTIKNAGSAPALGVGTMNGGLIVGPMPRTPEQARTAIGLRLIPPNVSDIAGILILPNDSYEIKALQLTTPKEQITKEPQEVWFTLCIWYKDEMGSPHGTGLLWRFDSDRGESLIRPVEAVLGSFTRIGIGNESY